MLLLLRRTLPHYTQPGSTSSASGLRSRGGERKATPCLVSGQKQAVSYAKRKISPCLCRPARRERQRIA